MSDRSAKWLTRLNKGVYEPEFRLILVIPQMIFGCLGWSILPSSRSQMLMCVRVGLFGFGFTMANLKKYDYPPSVVFFGFE